MNNFFCNFQEVLQIHSDTQFRGVEHAWQFNASLPLEHHDGPEEMLQPSLPLSHRRCGRFLISLFSFHLFRCCYELKVVSSLEILWDAVFILKFEGGMMEEEGNGEGCGIDFGRECGRICGLYYY